jgi:hypothetical protein
MDNQQSFNVKGDTRAIAMMSTYSANAPKNLIWKPVRHPSNTGKCCYIMYKPLIIRKDIVLSKRYWQNSDGSVYWMTFVEVIDGIPGSVQLWSRIKGTINTLIGNGLDKEQILEELKRVI